MMIVEMMVYFIMFMMCLTCIALVLTIMYALAEDIEKNRQIEDSKVNKEDSK